MADFAVNMVPDIEFDIILSQGTNGLVNMVPEPEDPPKRVGVLYPPR